MPLSGGIIAIPITNCCDAIMFVHRLLAHGEKKFDFYIALSKFPKEKFKTSALES